MRVIFHVREVSYWNNVFNPAPYGPGVSVSHKAGATADDCAVGDGV
ncbi:hypothetical protein GCM10011585_05200 [Edaphobacter dinghuensis]|uniref:Uncharacterized protein n=1 Tax=Edaphobacter dinghuensis TaxID=1560005 RepID=A0A917H3K5_9BACT|nr:hypothetical protein GCM10011585_05200 [Edaphobacter dinghuensis]